ncbi:LuxR C-terminal-related transcriptional regulator [Streptomyces sp. NPDC048567]|uniref:helix-turn-helix transcriptional regulator n=1 Tax=Streptomyces sp. NPDC048567 TaxID=3365570 RepID=UPI003721DAD3
MTLPTEHRHGEGELCDEAVGLYTQALTQGSIARSAAAHVPCVADGALLVPDPHDSLRLRPVPPTAGLAHLLHPLARQVLDQVRAIDLLAKSLVPLTSADQEPISLATLHGLSAIQASINGSAREVRDEILTIQPGSTRPREKLQIALTGTLPTAARGVRVRHIYQHSARYSTDLRAYVAQLPSGLLEVRTVERAIDRLIIFDRAVAYLPADPEGRAALEIRHPALVRYLAGIYETLWAGATPFTEHLPTALPGAPVTAVQQSIARLLIDGCTDQAAAEKLGISVRTCRAHIAKLMHTLNATSRTHLGALLIRSGLAEGPAGPVPPEYAKRPATPGNPG